MGRVTLTASKAPAVYNVYVNDVLQTPNAAGKVQMTGLPAGAKLVTEKVAGTLAATDTPTNVTDRGVLEYAVAAADVVPNTTDIKLYTAWDVTTATVATNYSVYTKNPVGAADAPDAVNAANLLFKTMDSRERTSLLLSLLFRPRIQSKLMQLEKIQASMKNTMLR